MGAFIVGLLPERALQARSTPTGQSPMHIYCKYKHSKPIYSAMADIYQTRSAAPAPPLRSKVPFWSGAERARSAYIPSIHICQVLRDIITTTLGCLRIRVVVCSTKVCSCQLGAFVIYALIFAVPYYTATGLCNVHTCKCAVTK